MLRVGKIKSAKETFCGTKKNMKKERKNKYWRR